MDSVLFAVNAVLPIVLIVALGYMLKCYGMLSKDLAKVLNKVVFFVLLPANLYLNVYNISSLSEVSFGFVIYAVLATLVLFFLGIGYAYLVTKKDASRGAIIQAVFRSNYALIGVPLATALFGAVGAKSAALLCAFIVPTYNILAVITLTVFEPLGEGQSRRRIDVKRILMSVLKNPLAVSVFAGLITLGIRAIFVNFNLHFRLSDITPVYDAAKMLSSAATPVALLALGAGFEFAVLGKMKSEIIIATAVRIVAVPALGLGVAFFAFDFTGGEYAALVAAFATPVAVSSVPMAQEMNADAELAGQIVVWTTIFSGLTMFLFIFALKSLGAFA